MAEKANKKTKEKNEESLADILSSVFTESILYGDPINFDDLEETVDKEDEVEEEGENEKSEEVEEAKPKRGKEKEEEEEEVDAQEKEEEEEPTDIFEDEEEDDSSGVSDDVVGEVIDLILDELERSGFLEHYEIPEDEEVSFDDIIELIRLEAQEKATKQIYQFVANLPDDLKLAIQWVLNGKSMVDFVKEYESIVSEKQFNIEKDDDKEKFIKWWLVNREQYDPDDAEEFIDSLKKKNKLDKYVKSKYSIYESEIEQRKRELEERTLREREEQERRMKEQKQIMAELLSNINEIDGLKITENDKKKILSALYDITEEVGNHKVTLFQRKLAEILSDKKKTILLAKLVLDDLNLSSLFAESERKLIRKMAGEDVEKKVYKPKRSTKTVSEPKPLIESLKEMFG
ncbi:MAG: hypothetical protein KatS3mg083_519 [Candidatus Dojkabacteria bacterium]|nr:MAG: hypothetical protein KatS3mg083_519 [Candidatus Dojkabacteria bacterium]